MSKFADLHIHTHYSDGTLTPQEVVSQALETQLCCIAITDHDTIEGIKPVTEAAASCDLEVIAGIEVSSHIHSKDIHILGYFVDCDSSPFLHRLKKLQAQRLERMQAMIGKLKKLGIDNIDLAQVKGLARSDSVGRPHLAALLKTKGWVGSVREAFDRFIGEGAPAYEGHCHLSPFEAIDLINQAKGVAVLAHPMVTQKDELIPSLVEAGLKGLEVFYPEYSANAISYYQNLAKKHGLICTGGSDAHGKNRPSTYIGKKSVPYLVVEQLKQLKGF